MFLFALLLFSAAFAVAQNCPSFSLQHLPQAEYESGATSIYVRQADGSHTEHRYESTPPFRRIETRLAADQHWYRCSGYIPRDTFLVRGMPGR
jgi:hypothetical protein